MKKLALIPAMATAFILPACLAENGYRVETVVEGIAVPWGMVWLPDGDMLVSDRGGQLHRVRDGKVTGSIGDVPEVHANGQGGLLDLELHPEYEDNGWLYISYSSPDGEGSGSNTALMRAKLEGDTLVEQQVLYKATPNTRRGQHYGSRIEFDDQGFVYFSVGDRGARSENPQDLSRDGGKVYRLHDDGRVPEDNPFVDREGALPAIFSWGHRNPQGMAWNGQTGQLWVHEHGPRGGDEVNVIKAGANYGWPILSYGINYNGTEFAEGTEREGFESPAWYWDPSIAPSGMTFITSDKYPDWQGDLLVGSLKFRYLVLANVEGSSVQDATVMFEDIGRVRNVRQGPDGYIYVATEGGGIKRIIPES
ncbi:PQQ-dependent sugar dehydrogenase [Gilvimarinus sp. F26214L]|uniref:PQQ-dependent sugar dehydrogenase n=1 Tax=Gilvimarinus sp. DZF01 TaxID=3461371 RepID=UPI0040451C6F